MLGQSTTKDAAPEKREESYRGSPQAGRGKKNRSLNDNTVGYLFLVPWFLGLFVLTAGPMLASLYLSFTSFDLLTRPEWVGLDNYVEMFTADQSYFNSLRVTFTYVFVGVPLSVGFALLVAALLNKGIAALGTYRSIYYLPSLMGGSVAVAILWRQVFGGEGLFNQFLALFGISGPNWVSSPEYALWTLILLYVWQLGAPMVIFLAGLKQIPQELYDAAAVDGAGKLSQFRSITVPMLTPLIFFNLVLSMINSFQAFTPAFIISGGTGGPLDSTLFYTLYLYQEGFTNFRMGYASAMAWVLLLIIGVFTAIAFRTARHWVHYGDTQEGK